jgi:CHAT domain-containing protein
VLAERQDATSPERTTAALMKGLARKTGAVYLSYWLAPGRSYFWVVTGDAIKCLTLPAANEIDALVREHQGAIANVLVDPLASRESAGDKLYRLLVAPAAPWLTAGAPVVVVPDGALHGINFETLPVDAPRRHYWIEDAEVRIAPSLAALIATAPPAAASGPASALLVGNAVGRPPEFPELKYAASEMTSVARHFESGRATVIDRERATPAAYRDARPAAFRFVHFAAHATANVESPLDSAVILSGPEHAYKLYARDVAAVPLAADLVTVSACRSAGERAYSGEGLVGFAWAFLRAGARRVVAGLWDVNDRSTADLMDRMYAELAAGEPPPRALRNAKLGLIRQGGASASPYAWGAFELFTVAP